MNYYFEFLTLFNTAVLFFYFISFRRVFLMFKEVEKVINNTIFGLLEKNSKLKASVCDKCNEKMPTL